MAVFSAFAERLPGDDEQEQVAKQEEEWVLPGGVGYQGQGGGLGLELCLAVLAQMLLYFLCLLVLAVLAGYFHLVAVLGVESVVLLLELLAVVGGLGAEFVAPACFGSACFLLVITGLLLDDVIGGVELLL